MSSSAINSQLINSIEKLAPFGNKNSSPIFLLQNIKIINPTVIHNRFIKCFVKKDKKIFKSISFNHIKSKISYEIINSKNNFDILVKVKKNTWNNKSNIELEIIDLVKKIN